MKGHRTNTDGVAKNARYETCKRVCVALATVLIVAVGVATCAGGSSQNPGVANVSSSTASASPSASDELHGTGAVAYAACVRAHGLPNWPDPDSSGHFPKGAVRAAVQQAGLNQSQFLARTQVCNDLLPTNISQPTLSAQQEQDYLSAAECMRSHGVPNFPDPTFPDGRVSLSIPSSIDQNSPQFTQATQICTKLIPSGLPYSGSGN